MSNVTPCFEITYLGYITSMKKDSNQTLNMVKVCHIYNMSVGAKYKDKMCMTPNVVLENKNRHYSLLINIRGLSRSSWTNAKKRKHKRLHSFETLQVFILISL